MKGFFTRQEIDTQAQVKIDLSQSNCVECGLYRRCKSPKMKYTGVGKYRALLLPEAPGQQEDEMGRQLVGETGTYFKKKLMKYGHAMNTSFYKINAVNCRPIKDGKNRTPTDFEVECCRPSVLKTIEELKPKFIIPMGGKAIYSLLGEDFRDTSISRWRGLAIPDQKLQAWLLPLFHPSYAMRLKADANLQAFYEHDLKRMLRHIKMNFNEDFPIYEDQTDQVQCIYDVDTIVSVLEKINNESKTVVIDWETTGLKPYVPGHKIVSMSFGTLHSSCAFPFMYRSLFSDKERDRIGSSVRKILQNQNIRKVAHNAKFEHIWALKILGVEIANWYWCTLQGTHCSDNRQSFSGLKFQTFAKFGQRPYDKHIQLYLKAEGKEFNRVEELQLDDLLPYNGLDTQWCGKLYMEQKRFYRKHPKMKVAFDLFNLGSIVLGDVQHNGIVVNETYCENERNRLKKRIKVIEDRLLSGEESQLYFEHTGKQLKIKDKDFSDNDLRTIFYDIMGLSASRYTEKSGLPSVDETTLRGFDNDFARMILKRRKIRKIEGTYLSQFMRETYDGMMHPFFDLIVPVSYRGSASRPSFQNIPKRDKQAEKATRRAIIAEWGFKILESDFSGIEVCINACYNKDPNLIRYVTDKATDMHRDSACDVWMLDESEITKTIRFFAKNMWVFPMFYGSWYHECAKNLWTILKERTNSGFTLYDHMMSKGITNFEKFEEHCKEVERVFWNERFKVYRDWKKDIQTVFRNQGYIETYLGFRFNNFMGRNECTNYPAQGTAFHVLLWTLIHVHLELKKQRMKSKIFGQIHDSMITNLWPEEQRDVIQMIDYFGTEEIRKKFDWIIVPLEIEHELTGINESWYDKREYKLAA